MIKKFPVAFKTKPDNILRVGGGAGDDIPGPGPLLNLRWIVTIIYRQIYLMAYNHNIFEKYIEKFIKFS